MDVPYEPGGVDPEVRPVFEQLVAEFGAEYEVWARVDNFGLWVSAGVVKQGEALRRGGRGEEEHQDADCAARPLGAEEDQGLPVCRRR
jgi:hypothetical protein